VPVITVAGLQFWLGYCICDHHRNRISSGRAWDCCFIQAVQNVDIPIMAAYLLMVSLIFVTINLVGRYSLTRLSIRACRSTSIAPALKREILHE